MQFGCDLTCAVVNRPVGPYFNPNRRIAGWILYLPADCTGKRKLCLNPGDCCAVVDNHSAGVRNIEDITVKFIRVAHRHDRINKAQIIVGGRNS